MYNVSVNKVKTWLQSQDTYTLHKPARKRFRRNRVIVFAMDSQWEADLVDLQSLRRHNKGYRYLLTCIDVLSKYAWVVPLKDKKRSTLVKAFQKILSSGRTPVRLFTDKGTEFKNSLRYCINVMFPSKVFIDYITKKLCRINSFQRHII